MAKLWHMEQQPSPMRSNESAEPFPFYEAAAMQRRAYDKALELLLNPNLTDEQKSKVYSFLMEAAGGEAALEVVAAENQMPSAE